MTQAVLVTSSWPVAVLVCPPRFSPEWIADVDRQFQAVFARERLFALVTDSSQVKELPAARERKLLGEWASRPDQIALQKRWNVGSSTIVVNPVMRGVLQALYWIWTPATPQHAARGLDDAWDWCIQMLETRGVTLPRPAGELRAIARRELESTGRSGAVAG